MSAERLPLLVSEWLLTYAIHSTALMLAVGFLARKTGNERSLERLWRIGLLGPILTTTLQLAVPGWFGALILVETAPWSSPLVPRAIVVSAGADAWSGSLSFILSLAVGTWAAIALLGLAFLVVGHFRLARLLRDRVPVSLRSNPRLTGITVATRLTSPVALLSGEVCLPIAALGELSEEELRAVVAHEREHVRRRDPWWLVLASAICRVLFFQPLNWLAARRLRSLAEFQCDSSAVRQTSRMAVASALVTVSRWIGAQSLVVAGMASRDSLTVRRVRRILETPVRPRRLRRLVSVAAVFLFSLAAVGPGVTLRVSGPANRYTIAAHDDGGPFNVTLERGKVVGVTMNGIAVPASGIRQSGNLVRITPIVGAPLDLTLTDQGGMRWNSRPSFRSLE